jgi:hypothetical protein
VLCPTPLQACGDIGAGATCSFGNPLHKEVMGGFSCFDCAVCLGNFLRPWCWQRSRAFRPALLPFLLRMGHAENLCLTARVETRRLAAC